MDRLTVGTPSKQGPTGGDPGQLATRQPSLRRSGGLAFRRDFVLNKMTSRGRLMASTMIAGATLLALGGGARAADAGDPLRTADAGQTPVAGAAPIATITASTDASADTTSSTAVTEIVVTGSRIPQPNLTSVSPIQAVSHQEFELTGTTDTIDLLNTDRKSVV